MATHSSIFAWRIPWTEEPGGLQSMGSQRDGHDGVMNPHLLPSAICLPLEHPHIKEPCEDCDPRVGRRSSAPCYFSALITKEDSPISPCYSLGLCIQMGMVVVMVWSLSHVQFLQSHGL